MTRTSFVEPLFKKCWDHGEPEDPETIDTEEDEASHYGSERLFPFPSQTGQGNNYRALLPARSLSPRVQVSGRFRRKGVNFRWSAAESKYCKVSNINHSVSGHIAKPASGVPGQTSGEKPVSESNNTVPARGGIILMRHGEAESNVENRFNSAPEHPAYKPRHLTSLGQEQASLSGEELLAKGITGERICRVFASPLPRAQETASIIADRLQIADSRKKTVVELIENQMGDREEQLASNYNDRDRWFPDNPESFGAENYSQIEYRVRRLLNQVSDDPECNLNEQYVLLVSHGVPIYVLLDLLTGKGERISPGHYRIIHPPVTIKN